MGEWRGFRTVTLKCEPCGTHRNVQTKLKHREPKRRCPKCGERMRLVASTEEGNMNTQVNLIPGKWCYYVPEDQEPARNGGYVPSVVVEGEAGHRPLLGNGRCASPWVWGTSLEKAQAVAERMNRDMDIDPDRASKIVASSMKAQFFA